MRGGGVGVGVIVGRRASVYQGRCWAGEEHADMAGEVIGTTPRARYLKRLAAATGLSSIVNGGYHLALGTASVPGATDANATVDSRERFYSAIFAGYGIARMQAARNRGSVGVLRAC